MISSKQLDAWLTEWLLFRPLGTLVAPFHTEYQLQGRTLLIKRPFRAVMAVPIDELDEIGIETTDQGPFAEDLFWILKQGTTRLRIGDPHPIFRQLMDSFGSLEDFDWTTFADAMSCLENRYFPCWIRNRQTPPHT
jgi:hypothetical protein